MKKNLIITIFACLLVSSPANAFDWGLGNKIATNIKNIFSRAAGEPGKGDLTQAEYYENKEAETLAEFLEKARISGYVTPQGEIDYMRLNDDPKMVARLDSIMNSIEPAAGPAPTEVPVLHIKPEKNGEVGKLRPIQ